MQRRLSVLAIAMLSLCTSCELLLRESHPPAPQQPPTPGGETSPTPPPGPYAHMTQRSSFTTKASVTLKPGCYNGDFVLGQAQLEVRGAGVGQTVIQGNLVVMTQCTVSNLTVTGDVIFKGNQGKLVDVDFLGRIDDRGVQNRY